MSQPESHLLVGARKGDSAAFESLVAPLRRPLFAYIYRMVTHPDDAEDLLQDVLLRVLQSLAHYREEAQFKTWLFGIATHVCLDHLRRRARWRVEAQMLGERETDGDPEKLAGLERMMAAADFRYEIREHIAFCFSCIARTLEPEEQAALLLKEVMGFTNEEAAQIAGVSEPVLRHRLSAARGTMIRNYEGLCQLINKTGMCHQCQGLREIAPGRNRGENLVRIEVAPGTAVTPESLFDARAAIVRKADLETGATRVMHQAFYRDLSEREQAAGR